MTTKNRPPVRTKQIILISNNPVTPDLDPFLKAIEENRKIELKEEEKLVKKHDFELKLKERLRLYNKYEKQHQPLIEKDNTKIRTNKNEFMNKKGTSLVSRSSSASSLASSRSTSSSSNTLSCFLKQNIINEKVKKLNIEETEYKES